jgi:hypothetical protein
VLAFGIAGVYELLMEFGRDLAIESRAPQWWWSIFETNGTELFIWIPTVHFALTLAMSAPFAVLICYVYGRRGLATATAITVGLFVIFDLGPTLHYHFSRIVIEDVGVAYDVITIVGTLPILTLIAGRVLPNYRLERP